MSKEKELLFWIRDRGVVRKHEIMEWGLKNYYTRADRTVRDFVASGKVESLSKGIKTIRGFIDRKGKPIKEAVYKFVKIEEQRRFV